MKRRSQWKLELIEIDVTRNGGIRFSVAQARRDWIFP